VDNFVVDVSAVLDPRGEGGEGVAGTVVRIYRGRGGVYPGPVVDNFVVDVSAVLDPRGEGGEGVAGTVVMSSDSHATITYTSMSSYEVIVNGYYGMPMDPLDPYVQLVMEAPPSPDYIPGPKAPPSPDYIHGPEAPPSPDYIPGPEYPEYLPPADDVLPAEEQLLPAAVSPTAELLGYITKSEPEMEPEEEDGNDEKSEGDSIEYPTSGGDDDGDDLSEDDADEEDEEESSNSEEEEEENLASTVPAPALYSSVSASEETKPFKEGETVATPPPFGYRVAARISI
nr:hypothetical protein [Tanacetum cinerariifolium]